MDLNNLAIANKILRARRRNRIMCALSKVKTSPNINIIDVGGVVQILVFQAYMVSLYLHFIAFDFLYVVEFSRSRI